MQFKLSNSIKDGVWSVLFTNQPSQLSLKDREAMRKYGEPLINVGGVFLSGTENEFRFPNQYKQIRSGFPYRQDFDTRDEVFAENVLTKIGAYSDAILLRITEGINSLRITNNEDTFSGESVINIGDVTYINTNAVESWVIGEAPSGFINGDNVIFTLSKPVSANKLAIYLNGSRVAKAYFDILSLDQFQLHDAPHEYDSVVVDYVSLFTI